VTLDTRIGPKRQTGWRPRAHVKALQVTHRGLPGDAYLDAFQSEQRAVSAIFASDPQK
jgi:hypothetical protein